MIRKHLLVAVSLMAVCMAHGQSEEKAIRAMVTTQCAAANRGDVTAYMATIDKKSASYDLTKSGMTKIFSQFKLKFSVESLKIVSVKGATARVQLSMITKKVSGPAFRDNRVKMTTDLVKRSGKWLMNASKVDGIEYLN